MLGVHWWEKRIDFTIVLFQFDQSKYRFISGLVLMQNVPLPHRPLLHNIVHITFIFLVTK